MGVSRDFPNFLGTPIISGTGKATDFKFCRNIHWVDWNKSPWKMLGIVAVGVVRDTRKFSGHPCRPYRAHCAVIFATAQLSCCRMSRTHSALVCLFQCINLKLLLKRVIRCFHINDFCTSHCYKFIARCPCTPNTSRSWPQPFYRGVANVNMVRDCRARNIICLTKLGRLQMLA